MYKNFLKRCKEEYSYWANSKWELKDVGKFWDSIPDYDGINASLYPYERRFINSYNLIYPYLQKSQYTLLDIQSRSGNGTLFWFNKGRLKRATCVDFSDSFLSMTDRKLKKIALDYTLVKTEQFPLPFVDRSFDLICTYETIEHVCEYQEFLCELSRLLTKDGLMILTCPNKSWDWVHSFTAILGVNHSEGPHRFLKRRELLEAFDRANLTILEENSTVMIPFNNTASIRLDQFFEKRLPEKLKRVMALRRTFVLKKIGNGDAIKI